MIPDFKTYIRESIWSDMQDRGTGDVEKKEDILVGAVKNLVPVDLGGKCLWADQDLEIDGQTSFTYDDASQFIDGVNGWRLPTFTDIINLDTRIMHNDYSFQDDELHITNRKTNGELVFSNQGPYPGLKGFYYFWHVDGGIRYGKASNFIKRENNKCVIGSFGSSDPSYTFCIRLVKDKEVSESVWSDMQERGTGDVEKKEDEVLDTYNAEELAKYLGQEYYKPRYDFTINYTNGNNYSTVSTSLMVDSRAGRMNAFYYTIDIDNPGTNEAEVKIPARMVVYDESEHRFDKLRDLLLDNFDIHITERNPKLANDMYYSVTPKNGGRVTNRLYIKLIDFIIDNADKSLDIYIEKR